MTVPASDDFSPSTDELVGNNENFVTHFADHGLSLTPRRHLAVVVCMGLAASMGQFLLTAGTEGKRYTLPNARIMMHQPLAGLRGQATDIAIQAEQLAHIKRKMAELTSFHSGKPIEQIQTDSERDRWFTAEEAQQYGLVDKVIVKRGEIR